MGMNKVELQYNSISHFYNMLYSGYDMRAYEETFINEYKEIIEGLPPNAKVLDSSCGNGIQVTALKRMGINVVGTDISEEMIKLTQQYSKSINLSFPTKRLAWEELPSVFNEEFDIVFCCGNSISHSISEAEMLQNIKSLYKVTKSGGKIVIDTRNWDKIIKENKRFETSDIKEYKDKKYVFTYVWSLNGFGEPSSVEILFIEIGCDHKTSCIPFKLDFMPFRHDEFIVRLQDCGLKIVKDGFQPEDDNYSVVLEK